LYVDKQDFFEQISCDFLTKLSSLNVIFMRNKSGQISVVSAGVLRVPEQYQRPLVTITRINQLSKHL